MATWGKHMAKQCLVFPKRQAADILIGLGREGGKNEFNPTTAAIVLLGKVLITNCKTASCFMSMTGLFKYVTLSNSKQIQSIVDIVAVWYIFTAMRTKLSQNCFLNVTHLINKDMKPHKTPTISVNPANLQIERRRAWVRLQMEEGKEEKEGE